MQRYKENVEGNTDQNVCERGCLRQCRVANRNKLWMSVKVERSQQKGRSQLSVLGEKVLGGEKVPQR